MTRVVVAKVGDIPAGGRKIIVPFRGRAGIGVFNVKGSFFVIRNICPHKQGPLYTGEVGGRTGANAPPSTPDALMSYDRDGEVLRCPWHAWPFEVATGQCLVDATVRVKTYPIIIDGENIIVDVEAKDFVGETLSTTTGTSPVACN